MSAEAAGRPSVRGVLVAVALGTILAPLNSTMIAIALPAIADDFDASLASAGWLVAGYLIVIALLTPFAGRLGDRFGHRRLFVLGLAAFGATSLGAALAPSLEVAIAFRALQAFAGAMSFPNGAALVRFSVPARRRAVAYGLVWGVASAAAAIGPTLGGVIVDGAGWRAMFYTSVVIAVAAIALGLRVLPGARREEEAEAAPLAFRGLLRIPAFTSATAGIALSNLAMYTTLLAVPVLLVDGRDWSESAAGLGLTVLSAPAAVLSPFGGRIADRRGRRFPVLVGLAVATAGLLAPALGADASPVVLACLGVAGIGFGLAFAPLQTAAIEAAPPRSSGAAAGLFSTSRYLGGIAGSLVLGAVLESPSGEVTGFQTVAVVVAVASVLSVIAALGLPSGRRAQDAAGRLAATS